MRLSRRQALAALLAFAGSAVRAQDNKRSFTIGVENLHYFPLHSAVHAGEFTGYARDVLDAFANEYGYTFRYIPLPINRLFSVYLNDKSLDFKYPDNALWQPARKKGIEISYSTPIVASEEGAMVLPSRKGLPIRTLGTVLGFTPWPFMDRINARQIKVNTANGFDSLLRLALAGHLDAVYVNVDVGNWLLSEQLKNPGGLVFDPSQPHAPSNFSMSTLRHHEVLAQFNLFLQRQRPLLQQLRAKYKIGDPITSDHPK